MALVAYDNSSESEIDDDNNDERIHSSGTAVLNKPDLLHSHIHANTNSGKLPNIFSTLPPPKAKEHMKEEDDEFLFKKETPAETSQKRIKIDIPTLNYDSSDNDDDHPPEKKSKKSVSGLFALLPPPKSAPLSNTSFVPNVLKKKVTKPPVKPKGKKIIPPVVQEESSKYITNTNESDSDDEIEIPETFDDETWLKVCGKQKKQTKPQQPASVIDQESVAVEAAPAVEQPYNGLNNEAFKELVGSSKRIPQNIKLIDIHEDEIRPDKELWLKSLTDPNFEPEPVEDEPVDGTRKARNHITALAQKAIANDKELQMRWSENRFNRKQTQAKYGF